VKEVIPDNVDPANVQIWFQDESRIGQQGTLTRMWAEKGKRTRVVRQQQYLSTYIYGAVCPSEGKAVGLVLPHTNTLSMQEHLNEISKQICPSKHGVLIHDRAGWHVAKDLVIPENLLMLALPSYSPELNPVEQIWQWLRQHFLSNRAFADYNAILDACCEAWNAFAENDSLIRSLSQVYHFL